MGMVDVGKDLANAKLPTAVEANTEAKVRIIRVMSGTDKNDLDYFQVLLEATEFPTSKDFTHFLHATNQDGMTPKQKERTNWSFKEFCNAFGFDFSRPFDPEDDWPGLEAWAILGVKKSDQYGDQNFVKTWILPK
jgi:hypothetical protein